MILFNYFDGATGPVWMAGKPAGWTNYSEGYAAAEVRGQAQRQALPDVSEFPQQAEGWPKNYPFDTKEVQALRQANWQRLCEEMRKAAEGGL